MKLVEREKHKLKIYQIGTIAQKRLARNITLNVVETIALLSMQVNTLSILFYTNYFVT